MSKITFRADEELVERIEARDASKSEIMRKALRAYLDREGAKPGAAGGPAPSAERDRRGAAGRERRADTLDALLAERVDELVAERLAARKGPEDRRGRAQDVNVNVTLESDAAGAEDEARRGRPSGETTSDRGTSEVPSLDGEGDERPTGETACRQCGESVSDDHVYCPNCGEKAARRLFCECGDEVRSDWGFCPSCGRRTPAADVFDRA